MTVKALALLIRSGRTEGLQEKMDVLFALGRLSESEYRELTQMMGVKP